MRAHGTYPFFVGTLALALLPFTACTGASENVSSSASSPAAEANAVPDASLGKRIVIKPEDLPAPNSTPSANNQSHVVPRPSGAELHVPAGFNVSVFAENLDNPRLMTVAPNGDVLVVESSHGRVVVLRDPDGTGKATQQETFAEGLELPFGIAIHGNYLYVANTNSVVRFPYHTGDMKASGGPETVVPNLPGRGYHQHWSRDLTFNPAGTKMYVSVGSQSNVGEEEPRRAAILEFNPDGSGQRVYASGIRNAVGKAFNPASGQLWTTCNERDDLGDDLVPDYVTSVKEGGFYGWPYYYIGQNHDPRMPEKPELQAKTIVPDVLIRSHSAALGMAFYTATQFPAEYHNDAFVALHGSWNRAQRTGYSVIRIPFKNGKPTGGYEPFVTGWELSPDNSDVWGRPVGVVVAKDGSLLISDDGGNKIWRIAHNG